MTTNSNKFEHRLPEETEEVYVTVGTNLPVEKRAVVRGQAVNVRQNAGQFTVAHEEVFYIGEFYQDNFENPEDALSTGSSGPYGPGFDEEYGKVWAFNRDELPV